MMDQAIKLRSIRPYSPHLNGKVERSQRTDWVEFYATVEGNDPRLEAKLKEWRHFYNWTHPHAAHGGRSSMERYFERREKTPFSSEVVARYDQTLEGCRARDYALDQQTQRLRRAS